MSMARVVTLEDAPSTEEQGHLHGGKAHHCAEGVPQCAKGLRLFTQPPTTGLCQKLDGRRRSQTKHAFPGIITVGRTVLVMDRWYYTVCRC
uniref:DDE_Tnp_1 domain-containing protein n=1 Tax=Panagrellus redivivus TaxID=6233 RepID=A0A7E4UZE3_PANRE